MALMGLQQGVKAKCRRCNNEALASEFRMHYDYKMMVCPNCFKGDKNKPAVENKVIFPGASTKPKEELVPKAPGWDKEDEYLERYQRQRKEKDLAAFKKIPGTSQVMYTCVGCKYLFKYDPFRKMPQACPYCDAVIPRVNTFNLL